MTLAASAISARISGGWSPYTGGAFVARKITFILGDNLYDPTVASIGELPATRRARGFGKRASTRDCLSAARATSTIAGGDAFSSPPWQVPLRARDLDRRGTPA